MLLCFSMGNVWATDDVINNAATSSALGSTGTTTWKTPDPTIVGASGAEYTIHSMGTTGTSNAIQWNKNGFLYQTKSGGTLKSVTIKGAAKKINIFASNSAYSAKATGTQLAQVTASTSGVTYTFESNYTYLAINGTEASTSITEITVTYQDGGCSGTKLGTPIVTATPSNGQVELSWLAVADASSYRLKWDGGDWEENVTSPVIKSNLNNGTSYTYQIQAIGDGTNFCDGDESEENSVTPNTTYDLTYYDKDGQHIISSVATGTLLVNVLPKNPTSCNTADYPYFVGWKVGSITGIGTTIPTILSSETVNAETAVLEYYAVWTNQAGSTTEYIFTSKDWAATSGEITANWTSGSGGNGFTSGQGNQITSGKSGANATSPISFTNVSNILVTYNTNASQGAGAVKIKIGDNDEVSNNVAYTTGTGTSANYTTSFNFSPYQSGNVKLTVTCTTNSIWLKSIAISTAATNANYITTCCTPLASINGSDFLLQLNGRLIGTKKIQKNDVCLKLFLIS